MATANRTARVDRNVDEVAVNFPARRAYAEVLRHFAAGRLTTDQYETAASRIERQHGYDKAVMAIFGAVWECYDDLVVHRLIGGYRLTAHHRRYIAQAILFLRSDDSGVAAEFPEIPISNAGNAPTLGEQFLGLAWLWHWFGVAALVISLFNMSSPALCLMLALTGTAGISLSMIAHWKDVSGRQRDRSRPTDATKPFDVIAQWPFMNRESLTAARRHPSYLCGVHSISLCS